MPRLDSAPGAVVDAIIAQQVDLVIPTRDADVVFLADHQDVLRRGGVRCMVASPDAVRTCGDKVAFARQLTAAGLPAIPTCVDPDDPLLGQGSRVVKERNGAGAVGMVVDVDAEAAATAAEALDAPCFQPFVAGPEFSIDAYRSRDGRLLGVVARSRDVVISGESAVTTMVDASPYIDLVRDVLDCLDLSGHAVIQVIHTESGPMIVECNARLGGASTLSLAAGLRSVEWFALESLGRDPGRVPFTPHAGPLQLVRVPQDVIRDPRL